MLRALRCLRRDDRAVTAIEFAMLAPVLIVFLTGAVELGRMATIKSSLETAVSAGAREARVDLARTNAQRLDRFEQSVREAMSPFPTFPGRDMTIEVMSADTFGASYPEAYEDANGNGQYDGPTETFTGEHFDDRNRNGVHDNAQQVAESAGGIGQVVTYRVTYPVELLFDFLAVDWGWHDGIELQSTVVLRNEPVQRTGG